MDEMQSMRKTAGTVSNSHCWHCEVQTQTFAQSLFKIKRAINFPDSSLCMCYAFGGDLITGELASKSEILSSIIRDHQNT